MKLAKKRRCIPMHCNHLFEFLYGYIVARWTNIHRGWRKEK